MNGYFHKGYSEYSKKRFSWGGGISNKNTLQSLQENKRKMKNDDWLKARLQILLLIISLFKRINVWTNNPFKYTYLQTSFSDITAKIILKFARI